MAARIISPQQYGFIKGRRSADCIALASEGVNLLDKKCFGGNKGFKIDIRKAFDTVEWPFLFEVLDAFRFSLQLRNFILELFSTARLSISINGQPKGYFGCSRGVQQGDPLSLLLFLFIGGFLEQVYFGLRGARESSAYDVR